MALRVALIGRPTGIPVAAATERPALSRVGASMAPVTPSQSRFEWFCAAQLAVKGRSDPACTRSRGLRAA